MIEELIVKLMKTKDGKILSQLNKMGVSVTFHKEGISWKQN